jgi:ribosomal protein S18 acetylase RimI-like enzyme
MHDSTSATHLTFRPAADVDRQTLDALIAQSFAATRFAEVPLYALRSAFDRPAPDAQAIVAESGRTVVGFALFGTVAGTIGTGRINFIGVPTAERRRGMGSRVCEAAVSQLVNQGARSIVAEIPDDPLFVGGRALLAGCGFVEVSRVADYYSDGVDLLILERSIDRV